MTIITDTSVFDGSAPQSHGVAVLENPSVSCYRRIGSEAGVKCGLEFQAAYPFGTNADVRKFFPAVMTALDSAVAQMKATGATEGQTSAWRAAFMIALDPFTKRTVARIKSEH